jgi:hypothetical protein
VSWEAFQSELAEANLSGTNLSEANHSRADLRTPGKRRSGMRSSQNAANPKFISARTSGTHNESFLSPIAHVTALRALAPGGPGRIKTGIGVGATPAHYH